MLNNIMRDVYEQFFGDAVELTDGTELTWMRQPHYYMGLYSYTYLLINNWYSCFTKIKQEGQPAVDAWLETLKAGGSQSPIELKLQVLISLQMHHLKLLLNISDF